MSSAAPTPPSRLPPPGQPAATPASKRLQMADIARLAGVSVSTVSRALAGSPLVNAETRTRVAELARSLNYSINLGAQNLRLQKNRTVAVVIPYERGSRQHVSDPFFLSLVGSLADALTERGHDMLLSRVDAARLEEAAALHDSGRAAGLIIIGQWHHHDRLNALAARGLPLVVWGGQLPQQLYCSVGGDNLLGGRLATEHLIARGARRIGFIGDASLPEVWLRREGHWQALQAAGLPADPALELAAPFETNAARQSVQDWLRAHPELDGIFACSDLLAIQALQCLRQAGRRIPQELRVVGYDDLSLASYCEPPLSTVHQPVLEAGAALVQALMDQLDGHPSAARTLPVHLVQRASS